MLLNLNIYALSHFLYRRIASLESKINANNEINKKTIFWFDLNKFDFICFLFFFNYWKRKIEWLKMQRICD